MSLTNRTQRILEVALCDDVAAKEITASIGSSGGGVKQTSTTGQMDYVDLSDVVDSSFIYTLVRVGDVVTIQFPGFTTNPVPAAQERLLQTILPAGYLPKADVSSRYLDSQFVCDGTWGRMISQITRASGIMRIFPSKPTENGSITDTTNWVAGEVLAINGTSTSWIADPIV